MVALNEWKSLKVGRDPFVVGVQEASTYSLLLFSKLKRATFQLFLSKLLTFEEKRPSANSLWSNISVGMIHRNAIPFSPLKEQYDWEGKIAVSNIISSRCIV